MDHPIKYLDSDDNQLIYEMYFDNLDAPTMEKVAKQLTYTASPCRHTEDECGCFLRKIAKVVAPNTIRVQEDYNH